MDIIVVVFIVIAVFSLLFAAFYAGMFFANVKNYFNLKKLEKKYDEILDFVAKYPIENEKFDVFDDVDDELEIENKLLKMTKKQLLDSLKDLSDDAVIYVETFSDDFDIDHTADYVEVKDIVSGNNVENEATIAAYF